MSNVFLFIAKMEKQNVFITGGAKGIGKAIVEAFYKSGATVAFCDYDKQAGKELSDLYNGEILFYSCDVADSTQLSTVINTLFNRWGDINIVINNVGIAGFEPLEESSVDNFDHIIATNLRPVFITSQALIRHRKNLPDGHMRYGRIINIASTRYLQSESGTEAYAASKGGVVSLTHALAVSFSDYNITVNCISPGWIQVSDYESLTLKDHKQHPSGRVGHPEDIVRMCLFLCEKESDFINGQNFTIDGGMTKKMIYTE